MGVARGQVDRKFLGESERDLSYFEIRPEAWIAISTLSPTRSTNVLGFFIPHFMYGTENCVSAVNVSADA